MAMMSELDIVRDFDRRIATLHNAMEVRNIDQLSELRLLRQELGFQLRDVRQRLTCIEKQLERPSKTDSLLEALKALGDRLWFKVAALAILATGNQQALTFLQSVWKN
jgi:hypothetical protein